MPPKHALALCKQKILRFWGLTAQRGWARLILDRFHDLVLSSGKPSAATHESESVAHEHNTIFFLDCGRGPANTAGFGWRGGSGVFSATDKEGNPKFMGFLDIPEKINTIKR